MYYSPLALDNLAHHKIVKTSTGMLQSKRNGALLCYKTPTSLLNGHKKQNKQTNKNTSVF